MLQGEARHPATQVSERELTGLETAHAHCIEIVSTLANQRFTPVETESEATKNLTRAYRARRALMAHALSSNEQDLIENSHPESIALAFAQYEQLLRLPTLIHRGQPVFSDELYKKFNLRPNDLAAHIRAGSAEEAQSNGELENAPAASPTLANIPIVADKPERKLLLHHVIEINFQSLTQALSSEEVAQRYRKPPLLPIWRLLVLRHRQLKLWNANQPDLLRERSTLTPLSKLYYAWLNRK